MSEPLPDFPYHPDPLATGSIVRSDGRCEACGRARGFVYAGPVFAVEELDNAFCPWCIADGTAAETFDAEFTDAGAGVPADVPAAVVETIVTRTPGFAGWQQEHWLYHCGDGAAFLGRVGHAELAAHPDALAMLRAEHDDAFVAALDRDGSSSAYLFRCRHCGRHLAYADAA